MSQLISVVEAQTDYQDHEFPQIVIGDAAVVVWTELRLLDKPDSGGSSMMWPDRWRLRAIVVEPEA